MLSFSICKATASEFIIDGSDIGSVQEIDRCFQEREILQSTKVEQTGEIADLKKSLSETKIALEAETRSKEASEKMNAVLEREIAATTKNFEQMKDVADRAIKLAETGKPKSVWETWGPLGVIAIIVVTIAAAL
jgi:hypothetical protein